jgi:hypothetical protein
MLLGYNEVCQHSIAITIIAHNTPSTITTKLANDGVPAFRVAVFVALESPIGVIDLDFRVVKYVDDGSDVGASSAAIEAAFVSRDSKDACIID